MPLRGPKTKAAAAGEAGGTAKRRRTSQEQPAGGPPLEPLADGYVSEGEGDDEDEAPLLPAPPPVHGAGRRAEEDLLPPPLWDAASATQASIRSSVSFSGARSSAGPSPSLGRFNDPSAISEVSAPSVSSRLHGADELSVDAVDGHHLQLGRGLSEPSEAGTAGVAPHDSRPGRSPDGGGGIRAPTLHPDSLAPLSVCASSGGARSLQGDIGTNILQKVVASSGGGMEASQEDGGSNGNGEAGTPEAHASSSDDEEPVAEVAAAIAEAVLPSDSEGGTGSPSSPSDAGDDDAPMVKAPGAVVEEAEQKQQEPGASARAAAQDEAAGEAAGEQAGSGDAEKDSDSDSSDSESEGSSSSGSSSSSSSESESEADMDKEDTDVAEGAQAIDVALDMESKRRRDLQVLRSAHLTRDALTNMVLHLPEEEARNAVLRSYVRITVREQTGARDACVFAEVVDIEPSPPYVVQLQKSDPRTVRFQLRCKRGNSTRLIKVNSVSNQEVTEAEFEQWRKLTNRTGVDIDFYLDQMRHKALDIVAARNFVFDDPTVSKMLKGKTNLEFDAQRESRMRFLVQCALSQMDISGIRDSEVEELEAKYKKSLDDLQEMEGKSARVQEEWFEKRPNLFSLKMINKKNFDRQVRDDRHALEWTLENERQAAGGTINPFQRRACRPISAWDTKLTEVEALKPKPAEAPLAPIEDVPAAPLAGPRPPQQASPPPSVQLNGMGDAHAGSAEQPAQAPEVPLSRVDCILRAHRRANLLTKFGALATSQASLTS